MKRVQKMNLIKFYEIINQYRGIGTNHLKEDNIEVELSQNTQERQTQLDIIFETKKMMNCTVTLLPISKNLLLIEVE